MAQTKNEREIRISEDEFPSSAYSRLVPYLTNSKHLRFYQEKDGDKLSYEAKFKSGKIHYSVEFDAHGVLEDVEYIIEEIDIPDASWEVMQVYLNSKFSRYRIKKIQQHYPNISGAQTTLKNAFQNLLTKEIRYEMIVAYRTKKGFKEIEILFNAAGQHLYSRESIPQKYDYVRY
ncbi:hypothetical protein [Croceivirga sp. JEA036]|uniref:hypothetical protein n=1 Tax=Croceivirga sp. JEA036 TaxID=2721162 RepID=UPI00143AF37F|nr:hypothetical protein [Croceivirga sp. JEA036]NJB36804.1 hypothetical protein [Croceivirga sp. JEA036]